jgi:two-component system nitrogen regulation sensor histidine kinase NtrY
VVIALVITAIVPLLASIWLARSVATGITREAFAPEIERRLEHSLALSAELQVQQLRAMQREVALMVLHPTLREAVKSGDGPALEVELARVFGQQRGLWTLEVRNAKDDVLAKRRRKAPIDATKETPVTIEAELEDTGKLVVVFAADRSYELESADTESLLTRYAATSAKHRGAWIQGPQTIAFTLLLLLTLLASVLVGTLVMRPFIQRIQRLAAATLPVAEGDLSVRVLSRGVDEIDNLAQAFNKMLEQLGRSRARIEFLKRMGEWQQMARRLAHEIKNPLTPIQLAVEECHRRYDGDNESYRTLLQTTLDIVVEEVASLRRLVGEFAAFARLPVADLQRGDLRDFIEDQKPRLLREELQAAHDGEVELDVEVEEEEMPVALDRTMLYRALSNLVVNAAQAAAAEDGNGRVRVRVWRDLEHCAVDVEDDGPGVPESMRQTIFDPYVTNKRDGTGLGLTIVKKVVIDHGGHIDVDDSELGGARIRLRLPLWGTSASEAAMVQSVSSPISP